MEAIKVYIPNNKKGEHVVGGGWTFLRNFQKAMNGKVFFVDSWEKADVIFIVGITMVEKEEIYAAHKAGKHIVLRVDNVPKKSRNKRSTPHERLKEFAELADVVVYQSRWAKEYCYPLCGDGVVIYNGVDTDIFYPPEEKPKNRYLFAYHGNSELKQFWLAHYIFQMQARHNTDAEFWFIYNFGRQQEEMERSNYDFWNGEKFKHLDLAEDAHEMAQVMRQCSHLIFPSVVDAAPNTVLEARACGLEIVGASPDEYSGTQEYIELDDFSLERMAEEYFGVFQLAVNMQQ